MLLPFPNAALANTKPDSARVPDPEKLADFRSRVAIAANHFPTLTTAPKRSAAVIYLGLCYLRFLHEQDKVKDGRDLCTSTYNALELDRREGRNINCSTFSETDGICGDHLAAVNRAMDLFMANQRNNKHRCAVALAIGANHEELFKIGTNTAPPAQLELPKSDSWLSTYIWRPPPAQS